MPKADRIAQLETILAGLIDCIEVVGCYDQTGLLLTDDIHAVTQARIVLGEEAWRRVIEEP